MSRSNFRHGVALLCMGSFAVCTLAYFGLESRDQRAISSETATAGIEPTKAEAGKVDSDLPPLHQVDAVHASSSDESKSALQHRWATQAEATWEYAYRRDCVGVGPDGSDQVEGCEFPFGIARSEEEAIWLARNEMPDATVIRRAAEKGLPSCEGSSPASICVALALDALVRRDFESAERWARIATKKAPEAAIPYHVLGEIYLQSADDELMRTYGAEISEESMRDLPQSIVGKFRHAAYSLSAASLLGDLAARSTLYRTASLRMQGPKFDVPEILIDAQEVAVHMVSSRNLAFAQRVSPVNRRPGW